MQERRSRGSNSLQRRTWARRDPSRPPAGQSRALRGQRALRPPALTASPRAPSQGGGTSDEEAPGSLPALGSCLWARARSPSLPPSGAFPAPLPACLIPGDPPGVWGSRVALLSPAGPDLPSWPGSAALPPGLPAQAPASEGT